MPLPVGATAPGPGASSCQRTRQPVRLPVVEPCFCLVALFMLSRLSRLSFWCAAIAAGLALLGPAAHARLLTVLSVLAGAGSFACWRLALHERRRGPEPVGPALPAPLSAASLLDAAARLVACCAGAPSLDAAMFGTAAVLKGELGASAVPVYRVQAIDTHQVTLVEARVGAVGASTVRRLVRLDDPALGQAVARRRVSGTPGHAWAVPVEQGAQCVAVLLVHGLALPVDDEALGSLLELAHVELSRRARAAADPARTDAPARRDERALDDFPGMHDDSLFVSNPERSQVELVAGSVFDLWGVDPVEPAWSDTVLPEDRPLLHAGREREEREQDCDYVVRIQHPRQGLRALRSRTRTRRQADGRLRVHGRVTDVTGAWTPARRGEAAEGAPPDDAAAAERAVSAAHHESHEVPAACAGRVLVVADNHGSADLIGPALRGLGCEVTLAASAGAGLQALCATRFDLLFIDVGLAAMPGLEATELQASGLELLARVRCGASAGAPFPTPPHTPVIAVTSGATDDHRLRLIQAGFDDTLPPPPCSPPLQAMLSRHLRPHAPVTPDDTPAPGAAAAPQPAVLDADALGRLRELDPKGENHLMERVLKAFETSVARLMPQLQAARADGHHADIRHVAHTLKSSSASIGALRLSQLCADIEAQVRLDRTEGLDGNVAAMAAEIDIVLKALRQLMDSKA